MKLLFNTVFILGFVFFHFAFATEIKKNLNNANHPNQLKVEKRIENQAQIQSIEISNKIHNEHRENYSTATQTFSAEIVLINRLSGFNNYLTIKSNEPFIFEDQNIKIELIDCKKDFDYNVKNYIAQFKIKNLIKVANKSEEIDFDGYVHSAFTYKNPIQNSLFIINLLNCDEEQN